MPELDRREFLKVVGVGAGSAAASGCSDLPEKLIPYVVQPEEITPGIPVIYASTCQECASGCGIHVRTREGRPIKLEGNPDHPVNRGTLCARGQAAIGRTFHNDRFRGPMQRGAADKLEYLAPGDATQGWEKAHAMLAEKLRPARGKIRMISGRLGPSEASLIDRFLAAVGGERIVYEPFGYESLAHASREVFGVESRPIFDLTDTDYVVDFGADALESWVSPNEHTRQLAAARDIKAHPDGGAHFVYVGPRLSLTAGNSDEWLTAKPGTEGILALGFARVALDAGHSGAADPDLLRAVLRDFDVASVSSRTGVPADAIRRIGHDLAESKRPAVLPPGVGLTSRRATATNAAVLLLGAVVGAVGKTIQVPPEGSDSERPASFRKVLQLVDAMKSGDVDVLLVHGANPVYSLPPDAGFAEALDKVGTVVSFASMPDETSGRAHLVLPNHTPLESWGDSAPRPGVRSLVQPTLRPLFASQAVGDTLLETARAMGLSDAVPSGSFRGVVEASWAGGDFRAALARGGDFADFTPAAPSVQSSVARLQFTEPKLEGEGRFVLMTVPSPNLGDGSGANLPWLQETPDPVTKIAWQSWLEISRAKADEMGLEFGDVVEVKTPFGSVEVAAMPRGGIRDDVVALAIGQGHTAGRYASRGNGEARGVNAVALLPALTDESGGRAWLTARAEIRPTGRHDRPPLSQGSDNKRNRQLGETISLAALAAAGNGDAHGEAAAHGEAGAHGEADAHGGGHDGPHVIREPFDPAKDALSDDYRWGMNVDLDRCTGCSACVVACAIENNVPQVGEEGVSRRREMSWIRIERFVTDGEVDFVTGRPLPRDSEQLGNVDVRHSPMMCQQCGAAPCEPVCPVYATYHNEEGLNGMIYNRCIGTRYCANNCPYKVRRFNWYDYAIEQHGDGWMEPDGSDGPPEPMRFMLNPDVTVRGQGVMEKCTFCVQRVQVARQTAKDEGRPIADGEAVPACAQTCPSQAITFGNLKDEKSQVVTQAAEQPARSYYALHMLNTRPAVNYLKKVTRGPDAHGSKPKTGEHA